MISDFGLLGLEFLSPAALGWLAAAAVPLVLHLWNRRRFERVDWAAMRFLEVVLRRNRRRIRVRQWLLLLLRTALLVLIVLAAAEPTVERFSATIHPSSGHTHRVVLLDGSFSMQVREGGSERFEEAKQAIARLIEVMPEGDGATLILAADPASVIIRSPVFLRQDFLAELRALKPVDTGSDWTEAMRSAREIALQARQRYRRLDRVEFYCFSDLQRSGWSDGSGEGASRLREAASKLSDLGRLTVVRVGDDPIGNGTVDRLVCREAAPTVAQEVELSARVKVYGAARGGFPATAEWFLDGRRVERISLEPSRDGVATVSLVTRIGSSGDHVVELRIDEDALPVDDRRRIVVPVREAVRALCVDGRPSPRMFGGASDYLVLALSASEGTAGKRISVDKVPDGMLSETDLDAFDVVFLCDVPHFTPGEARQLRSYVQRGGGIVFFAGPNITSEAYNRTIGPQGEDLLPGEVSRVVDAIGKELSIAVEDHPIVEAFAGRQASSLLFTPVDKLLLLDPLAAGAVPVLRCTTGEPVVTVREVENGRVVFVAVSADRSWSAWPLSPSYVPLIHEIVDYAAAGDAEQRNVIAGNAISGAFEGTRSGSVTVTLPDGERRELSLRPEGNRSRWRLGCAYTSGIVTVSVLEANGTASATQTFAVNCPAEESNLACLNEDAVRRGPLSGVDFRYRTTSTFNGAEIEPGPGSVQYLPVWLLWCALVVCGLEFWVAWRSGQGA
ncbi:hypothetical protein JCM19992_15240 [Thermostilla marina]